MKKTKLLVVLFAIICVISTTYAYYFTKTNITNVFRTEEYTFKINANGGKFHTKDVVVEAGTATLPIPDRKGYTFLGFSKEKDGNVDYNSFIDNVEDINNVTIYAKWQTNKYSISYNLNGGAINNPKDDYTVEDSFTLPIPVKDSYVFIGWTGSNGTTPKKNVNIPKGTTGDLSYTANWSAIDYKLTYILNGGSISGQRKSYNIETETFILPPPTKKGYSFTGWTGSNGTNKQQNVTIYKGSSGDKSYTANWQVENYSISYNLNGGNANNLKNSYTVEEAFSLATPTRKGYVFAGWTGSNGTTKQKIVTISKGTTGNKTYTANWTIENYSISYNLNGGNANNLKNNYTIEETFTLPIPTKQGHDFIGWTGSNGSIPQKSVTISKGTTGNKTYAANWRKYDANDYGGIYLVSTKNGATWSGTLDGTFAVGTTSAKSGNWLVTVNANSVYIYGTMLLDKTHTYCMNIYRADNHNILLASQCKTYNKDDRAIFNISW